jgi:hypothetical protein
MTLLLIIGLVWLAVAVGAGLILGRAIRLADRQELQFVEPALPEPLLVEHVLNAGSARV